MKTFEEWLEEAKDAEKPKDKKKLGDEKEKKVERPPHHSFNS